MIRLQNIEDFIHIFETSKVPITLLAALVRWMAKIMRCFKQVHFRVFLSGGLIDHFAEFVLNTKVPQFPLQMAVTSNGLLQNEAHFE